MFIHRPDKSATEKEIAENKVQQNVAEILIEKHRSGSTGMVKLYFKGECTKFLNLSETGDPEDPETKEKPVSVKLEGVENLPERESAPAKEEVKPVITETEDDIF